MPFEVANAVICSDAYWVPLSELGRIRLNSDAGSQYTAVNYTEKLALDGIAPSIGSVGDAYDNALMESINGLYKAECIRTTVFHDGPFKSIGDVEYATTGWVEWYNTQRLHSSLGYVPPAEFEDTHYAALSREPRPAEKRQETWGTSAVIGDPQVTY